MTKRQHCSESESEYEAESDDDEEEVGCDKC